ncbi:MAG TPA: hypothetical protein VID29_05180 [Solirubrobacteraceae bacterium]
MGRAREDAVLGRYVDLGGVRREIVARSAVGSVLVLDRDALSYGDARLVAHLDADEPAGNAALVCREYLRDPHGRWCRAVTPEDLAAGPRSRERTGAGDGLAGGRDTGIGGAPAGDGDAGIAANRETGIAANCGTRVVTGRAGDAAALGLCEAHLPDGAGRAYRLEIVGYTASIPQLRWRVHFPADATVAPRIVSVRDVVAALESYEPARSATARALARHDGEEGLSLAKLRAELERLDASRIVLNRGLREAVLEAVRTQGVSMSEIALRCGRVKRDGRGNRSGETSWLARRIGLLAEGGGGTVTPWVHSEVLALIARRGLGVSPREVELG